MESTEKSRNAVRQCWQQCVAHMLCYPGVLQLVCRAREGGSLRGERGGGGRGGGGGSSCFKLRFKGFRKQVSVSG